MPKTVFVIDILDICAYHFPSITFPLHQQHNHAPGIAELPSGELFVTWYRGSGERTP